MTTDILFVTELRPCPPHGGQFIRCHNVIDSLCQHFSVVVLAPAVDVDCKLMTQVKAWYPLPPYGRSALARVSNFCHRLSARSAWVSCLKRIYRKHQPQVTWFDYGHWGQYAAIASEGGTQTIMGTHNAQAVLAQQAYRELPLGKAYVVQWVRYWAQRVHERCFFSRFDRIVSVSEADRRYHARFVGDERSLLVPNYVNEADYALEEPVERLDDLVVMTGNWGSFQNRRGLNWFLQRVWPRVRQQVPRTRLQLVGQGCAGLFEQPDQHPSVTCVGVVPAVTPYLRQATIAVVPLLHGGGTRFKILEALACETPVVSTTLGAQGLDLVPGESILLADTGPDFAQTVVSLLQDGPRRSRLARNGLNVLRNQYSFDVNTKRIRQLVAELGRAS